MNRSSHATKERIRNLISLDICADEFSPRRAVITILEQRGRQICDVLLDQAIWPGVGNIIKNEVRLQWLSFKKNVEIVMGKYIFMAYSQQLLRELLLRWLYKLFENGFYLQ